MRRVFLSFIGEDKKQVDGVRLMAWNDGFALEFYDESVRTPYESENAAYIRSQIKPKILRSGVVVCLISAETHKSLWVDWELRTAVEANKKIIVMALPGHPPSMTVPQAAVPRVWYAWNPQHLHTLIESAP